MTGTWRDTLFVWCGRISSKKKEDCESYNCEWQGTWIGCEECPDARTSPTPTDAAFKKSDMTFRVSGKLSKCQTDGLWTFELTSGTWDLPAGQSIEKHEDEKHHVLLSTLPWKNCDEDRPAVVATGYNAFGSFVSAGYIEPQDPEGKMILARRYLDDRDVRASWSTEELYEKVKKTDLGTLDVAPQEKKKWYTQARRVSPWRSIDLHAEKFSKKRKRKISDESTGNLPALNIPKSQFTPRILIHSGESNYHEIITCFNDLEWTEQCCGCGNEIRDAKSARFIEVSDLEPGVPESSRTTCVAFYCNDTCICNNVAKKWAQFGESWQKDCNRAQRVLKSNGISFWKAIEGNCKSLKMIKDAGWHIVDGSYVCSSKAQDSNNADGD